MLFFVTFGGGLGPMLVDAASEADVPEMCTRVAERTPKKIAPIPSGVCAFNLLDGEEGELLVEPLEEIAELLEALDEELDDGDGEEGEEEESDECGDECTFDGEAVTCSLAPHEDGRHEGKTAGGDEVTW